MRDRVIINSILIILILVDCTLAQIIYGGEVAELLPMIAMAESSGDPTKINERTQAYGLHQITAPALTDYNNAHNTSYTLNDLLSGELNTKVALWYLGWIDRQLTKASYPNDSLRIVVAYIWGIGKLKRNGYRVPDWFMTHRNKVYRTFFCEEIARRKRLP